MPRDGTGSSGSRHGRSRCVPGSEPIHQPEREAERCAHHRRVRQDLSVARPDVLDADRGPVHADRVATTDTQVHQLIDRSIGVDHEVRADPGELAQMDRVRCERRPRAAERRCRPCSARRSRAGRAGATSSRRSAGASTRPSANDAVLRTGWAATRSADGGCATRRPASREPRASERGPRRASPPGRRPPGRVSPGGGAQPSDGRLAPEQLERLGQRGRDLGSGHRRANGLERLAPVQPLSGRRRRRAWP